MQAERDRLSMLADRRRPAICHAGSLQRECSSAAQCARYFWKAGDWSTCDTSCAGCLAAAGLMSRAVHCWSVLGSTTAQASSGKPTVAVSSSFQVLLVGTTFADALFSRCYLSFTLGQLHACACQQTRHATKYVFKVHCECLSGCAGGRCVVPAGKACGGAGVQR